MLLVRTPGQTTLRFTRITKLRVVHIRYFVAIESHPVEVSRIRRIDDESLSQFWRGTCSAELLTAQFHAACNLLVAQTPPAALAAKAATTTIPIVFVAGFDPIGGGLVESFARPGGNVTGLSLQQTDIAGKRLSLLRDLAPKSSVIAMLVNPIGPNTAPEIRDVNAAAQATKCSTPALQANSTPHLSPLMGNVPMRCLSALMLSL